MKAMILAAGRGERLKPFTITTPKPLLKIGNTTLLGHVLDQIKTAGITEVVINVHHLGDQIMQYCADGSSSRNANLSGMCAEDYQRGGI